jgi:hypothetical protein
MLTDVEKRVIADHASDDSSLPGGLFNGATFIEIARTAFLEKHCGTELRSEFQSSVGFISDFKQRNRFSSRRRHMNRSCATEDEKMPWLMTLTQPLCKAQGH